MVYEGERNENNEKHGYGKNSYANGECYEGDFKHNKKDGKGTYTYVNGDKYKGEFVNGYKHGKGEYIYNSGESYFGQFVQGKKHGAGTYNFIDGSKYIGDFMDDMQHGQGTYSYISGAIYVGDWKYGEFDGEGAYLYPSGDIYSGFYHAGKLHGKGTYQYVTGERFDGEFVDGIPIGPDPRIKPTSALLDNIDNNIKTADNKGSLLIESKDVNIINHAQQQQLQSSPAITEQPRRPPSVAERLSSITRPSMKVTPSSSNLHIDNENQDENTLVNSPIIKKPPAELEEKLRFIRFKTSKIIDTSSVMPILPEDDGFLNNSITSLSINENTESFIDNHTTTTNIQQSMIPATSSLNHAPPGLNNSHGILHKGPSFNITNNNHNNNTQPSDALIHKLKRISTVKTNNNDPELSDKLLNSENKNV